MHLFSYDECPSIICVTRTQNSNLMAKMEMKRSMREYIQNHRPETINNAQMFAPYSILFSIIPIV